MLFFLGFYNSSKAQNEAKIQAFLVLNTGECALCTPMSKKIYEKIKKQGLTSPTYVFGESKLLLPYAKEKFDIQNESLQYSKKIFQNHTLSTGKSTLLIKKGKKILYEHVVCAAYFQMDSVLNTIEQNRTLEVSLTAKYKVKIEDFTKWVVPKIIPFGKKLFVYSDAFDKFSSLAIRDGVYKESKHAAQLMENLGISVTQIFDIQSDSDQLYLLYRTKNWDYFSLAQIEKNLKATEIWTSSFTNVGPMKNFRILAGLSDKSQDFNIFKDTLVLKAYHVDAINNPKALPQGNYPYLLAFALTQDSLRFVASSNCQLPMSRQKNGRGYYNLRIIFDQDEAFSHVVQEENKLRSRICQSKTLPALLPDADKKIVMTEIKSIGKMKLALYANNSNRWWLSDLSGGHVLELPDEPNMSYTFFGDNLLALSCKILARKVTIKNYALHFK